MLNEFCSNINCLLRRHVGYLLAESRHELVFVGTFSFKFLKVRGVSFYLYRLARFCKHGLLREVREHHNQRSFFLAWYLIGESSALNLYGVYAIQQAISAVNIELTLV